MQVFLNNESILSTDKAYRFQGRKNGMIELTFIIKINYPPLFSGPAKILYDYDLSS